MAHSFNSKIRLGILYLSTILTIFSDILFVILEIPFQLDAFLRPIVFIIYK